MKDTLVMQIHVKGQEADNMPFDEHFDLPGRMETDEEAVRFVRSMYAEWNRTSDASRQREILEINFKSTLVTYKPLI